ncbi:MAG: polysaccharide biosynthesis tyrosine autokinase [Candidatus Dormiibacterota bacterium]
MELRRYLRALRRGLWLLILCPLLAGLVAGVISWRLPPVYQANASMLVRPAQPLSVAAGTGTVTQTSDEITQTYAQLMVERPILQKVIGDLKLNTTPDQLQKDIQVTPRTSTTILDITVSNTNRALARDVANQLMSDFIGTMKQVQAQENAPGTSPDNFVIVSPAALPTSPSSPSIPRNVVIAAAAALLLAVGAALLRDYLDQSVKSDEELIERTGLVPIAHIAYSAARRERRGELTVMQELTPAAEAYRSLRTNLLFSTVDRPVRTIVVTSASPDEGKSRTAANLAVALAQSGHRTVLVDADFRRPSQHRNFGFVRNVGLSNLVIQEMTEHEVLSDIEGVADLALLPSGPTPPNPSELLGSARTRAVLGQLQSEFEFVVLDTPPVNAVTDAAVLSSMVDGVILVIESGRTTYSTVLHAKQALDRVGAHVIGAVVNKLRPGGAQGYYSSEYYYGYGARQSDELGPGIAVAEAAEPEVTVSGSGGGGRR